ncbi:MAG: family 78 glycoside hydrolase catalytic domain [Oscillospiraceae bacterium]|nr:family 78 glycoside hydrolase catalytic domain [Oscillospiraceae bacterium]
MLMKSDWITFKTGEYKSADDRYGNPSPYFRKEFSVQKHVQSAQLLISALGVFRIFLNGKPVSDDHLAPGWVDYSKKLPLITYNLTDRIEKNNAVGVVLGDGWAVGHIGSNYAFKRNTWNDRVEFSAELRLEYADGSLEIIPTDASWKAAQGAIRRSDIYMGEYVDARMDLGGFSVFGYDDSSWENAEVPVFKFSRNLYLQRLDIPPVRVKEIFPGKIVSQTENTVLYDFSQNLAGVLRCRVKGERGARIVLRHGEVLDEGKLYTDNLRKAEATDTYILRGDPNGEEFRPLFTYHGFRYAEITVEGTVELLDVSAEAMYTDLESVGQFRCSDEIVNQIYSNAMRSLRGNLFSVPTDCPQRDERLGWLGDAQVFCRSAMFNVGAEAYYAKYLADIRDAQLGNGAIPAVAPLPRVGFYAYTGRDICGGWSEAGAEITYNHYLMYGDKKIIFDNLPSVKRLLTYYLEDSTDFLREGGNSYGDWLSVGEITDKSLVANVYFARAAYIAYRLCEIIGDGERDTYKTLYENIRTSFRKAYLANGRLHSDTQSAYVLAYKAGLISDCETKDNLLRRIRENNGHLSCGFLGIRFLLPTLCELGLQDTAYDILTQTSFPGWGYSVVNGATTIWEHWDSNSAENLKGMNSFNHYSLGSCVEWLYEYCLGISVSEETAGFARVRIRPYPDRSGKITSAQGEYKTKRGTIAIRWKKCENGFLYEISLPNGIEAEFDFGCLEVRKTDREGEKLLFELTELPVL